MDRDLIFRRHVQKHTAQPIIRQRGQKVDALAESGGAKSRRHRIAAKRYCVIVSHRLVVAGGHGRRKHGHVNVGLADKKRVHLNTLFKRSVSVRIA